VLRHLHRLWGFDVHLESMQGEQRVAVQHMPPRREREAESAHFDLIARPV
jgi:spore cortex formation protein SpoVR/YcgB (stage V sporulation)